MDHIKQGYRFENDWPWENLAYISQNYKAGVTIPVDVNIDAEQHVLNLTQVKRILRTALTISLMDCQFRKAYGHCAAPVKVCLDLNHVAERHVAEFGTQKISSGALVFQADLCFGCGLCTSSCPTSAISLVEKGSPLEAQS